MNQSIGSALTTCRVCLVGKLPEEYYSDKSKPRGHGTECKECTRDRGRRRYAADRDAWIERSRANKEAAPERYRKYNREYSRRNRDRTANREREYRSVHRERYNAHSRAHYERNIEHSREVGRLNASARRARIAGNGNFQVTSKDLARALSRTRGCCYYCCRPVGDRLQWDHVIPIARGGRHSVGNLVPACSDCNLSKSARLLIEWRRTTVL